MASELHAPSRADTEPLSEDGQTAASLYAAGAMSAEERAAHELAMERDPDLMAFTTDLLEATTAALLPSLLPPTLPAPEVKQRVLGALDGVLELERFFRAYLEDDQEAAVVTDADGRVRWVNAAFTRMCGYSLDELRGQKPGVMLQGEATERDVVARVNEAISLGQCSREELVNYHKDGHPYRVRVAINPIFGPSGSIRGFVALESELHGATSLP